MALGIGIGVGIAKFVAAAAAAGGGGGVVIGDIFSQSTSAGDLGTATGPDGGHTYTRVAGDVAGQSLGSVAYWPNGDSSWFRADEDLLTEDMYAQFDSSGPDGSGGSDWDICALARVENSANNTHYAALLRHLRTPGNWSYTLQRRVNGSPTNLASDTTEAFTAYGATVRIECSGTTIKFFRDGVEKLSVTDSNISGNQHAGLAGLGGLGRFADNFEAGAL